MADLTLELLRELTEAPGISGYEQEVREIIRDIFKTLRR